LEGTRRGVRLRSGRAPAGVSANWPNARCRLRRGPGGARRNCAGGAFPPRARRVRRHAWTDHPRIPPPRTHRTTRRGCVDVPGAPEWQYLAIHGGEGDTVSVELAGPDDANVAFTVPSFLNRGDELGEVARIVIRAWERTERAAGLGA
jgi:hypothetical protein